MNWNFIHDENLNVNRVPNRNSLMKFEDGPLKDKDLRERMEEIEEGRNTLLRLPDTLRFVIIYFFG